MKTMMRTRKTCIWILLVLFISVFAFVAYNWLSYCPPNGVAKFVFSGAWFMEEFNHINAGLALDQPTIGKFFLWTSIMSYLACTIVLLLHTIVDPNRHLARRCVNTGATLLIALVLIELLAPTFLLVQYALSVGMTIRRFLGFCLCCGFWTLLPSLVFWIRRADPSQMKWIRSPLTWALACSLVAPAYYSSGILHLSAWRHWSIIVFLLVWLLLIAPLPCAMWLRGRGSPDNTEPPASGNGEAAALEP